MVPQRKQKRFRQLFLVVQVRYISIQLRNNPPIIKDNTNNRILPYPNIIRTVWGIINPTNSINSLDEIMVPIEIDIATIIIFYLVVLIPSVIAVSPPRENKSN